MQSTIVKINGDIMILATYQTAHWKTEIQCEDYSKFKALIGVPTDKKIYWCFAANSVEQAVINSFCTKPTQPARLIMFETDNYIRIDKIKWRRYAVDNIFPDEDILNVEHEDAVEYIVTEIPEIHAEIPLDLGNFPTKLNKTQVTFLDEIRNSSSMKLYAFMVEAMVNAIRKRSAFHTAELVRMGLPIPVQHVESIMEICCMKTAFDSTIFAPSYRLGLMFLEDTEQAEKRELKFNLLTPPACMNFHNRYKVWEDKLKWVENSKAHKRLARLHKDLYKALFLPHRTFSFPDVVKVMSE